jgi:glycosyltransferase involved in cell wall biosynthesis
MSSSVLFDARLVLEKPTGIGQYICSLLPEMIKQAPDWHFHLLRRPSPWPGYDMAGWSAPNLTHHISQERHMSLRQHFTLPRLAQDLHVDLLHYPHFDAPVLWGRVPVVATLHDAKYLVRPDFFTNLSQLKRLYMRFSFGQTIRRAAAVITISNAAAADFSRLFTVPLERFHVIYEAADDQFRPVLPDVVVQFQERMGLKRPFILTVGERRPHKNHVGLIGAYAQSDSRHSHDLLIVGQAYRDYTEPEAVAQQLGLANQIHFMADLTFADLIAAYTAADLFVLVSFYEGFGLPLIEAMQCDTPVIAASTTGAGEIVGAGGLTVNPANQAEITAAIDNVLQNQEQRQKLKASGRQWHTRFSWEQAAAQTLQVYEELLN